MKLLRSCLGELFGLFVDDGNLALYSLLLIGATAAAVKLIGVPGLAAAGLLLAGLLAILAHGVLRAARRPRR